MHINDNLIGSRICIRNYTKEDLDFSTSLWFDEEIGKYMSDPTREYVNDEYRQALEELQDNDSGYYLIVQLKNSEELLGTCGVFPNEEKGSYDIGYCLDKKYWKKGYGTELIGLLIDWIKASGGKKITAEVAVQNEASNALLRKHGFEIVRETEFRKYNMDIVFKSYIYQLLLE